MTSTRTTAAATDLANIRQAVSDYCEGYYRRDKDQTHRAYHPECLKRSFERTEHDVYYLITQTSASMVDVAGITELAAEPEYEIVIDDVAGDIASVRLYSDAWIDYLHVVKARGQWKLLHATYTARSDQGGSPSEQDLSDITQVATDYVEGWYLARPDQHLGAYHDECVRRAFKADGGMATFSGAYMAEQCAQRQPDINARWTITIDDVADGVSTVRISSTDFVDHLHIARARDRWGLLHASFHAKAK